mgnify:FL=1|tara:strand:- start:321 stop:536 length:216 start_codon:yes stop_codon:yes gene_type:complete
MMEIMKPFLIAICLLLFASVITSLIYGIGSQKKKCIDGKVHELHAGEYWQGTSFTCKLLGGQRINEENKYD